MRPRFTVGRLAQYIKKLFTGDFLLRDIEVEGEVSNVKYQTSGHLYFTLKDGEGALSCAMFAGQRRNLNFRLTEGMKVIAAGAVSTYEKDSSYKLYVKSVVQSGRGELFERYEALKKQLEETGLFDPMYKKPIPQYAFRIGVVTAQTGAAIQDIINISHRRNPYVQLLLAPAQVQGDQAAPTIAEGIRRLDRLGLDVIIVGRGGGSLEDLWAFNEESVVRAVFAAQTPIISAVGHETDTTLIDYVSDLRAPTPSAAAELAVFDIREYARSIKQRRQRLSLLMEKKLRLARLSAENKEHKLASFSPENRLSELRMTADRRLERISLLYARCLELTRRRFQAAEEGLSAAMEQRLRQSRQTLALKSAALEGLSPLKKLSGGYGFVEKAGGSGLCSVQDLSAGDGVRVILKDGSFEAEVKEICYDSGNGQERSYH